MKNKENIKWKDKLYPRCFYLRFFHFLFGKIRIVKIVPFLKDYERRWYLAEGNNQKLFYRLKEAVFQLTDDELNRTAADILKLPPHKRTIVNIFKAALLNKPQLIFAALKVFKDQLQSAFEPAGAWLNLQ